LDPLQYEAPPLQTLASLQLPPSEVPTDALAIGATTVCSTGTDQAIPPTMPAFLRKSRREDAGALAVEAGLDNAV
jgi:hypothetical protein